MTQSFRTLLCATTILAGLALAPAAQAGPNGPSPNISPSMGGMSSMRMDFNMRAPNALRDRDTTGVRNGALSCATGEHCPRPSRRNRNNNAGNSGKTKVPAVVRAAPLRAAPSPFRAEPPPAPIVDISAVKAEPPVAPIVDIPAVEAEPPVAPIDGILGVQNPVPASGGADKEQVSDTRGMTPGSQGGRAVGVTLNAPPSLGGGETPSPTGEQPPINPDLVAANAAHIQQLKELESLLNGPLSMLPEILRGGRDGGFKGPVLGQGGRGGSETINSPTAGLGGRSGYAKDGGSSSEWVEYTRETTRHGGASGRRYTTTETFYVGEGRTWRRTETTDSRGGGSRITDEVEYQDENGDSHTWVVDTASDGRGNSSTTYSHDGVAVMADGTPEYKDPGPQPTATFVGEEGKG